MKPGRLLIAVTDLEVGGTPTVIEAIAPRLVKLGWAVTVVSLSAVGPVGARLLAAGVPVVAMNGRGGLDLRVILRLRRHLKENPYDICLAFLFHAQAAMRVATIGLATKPPVVHVFQTTQPDPSWHWKIGQRLAPCAAALVGPTESVARAIEKYIGVAATECVVIPNGVELPATLPSRIAATPGKCRVGFLGRLDRIKRVDVLLDAVKGLEGITVSIGGEGPEGPALRELASSSPAVTFEGLVADKWAWFARQDVLVLPSEAEGFGLVLIEAMAAGVPVVGAESPGITDMIQDGKNGLLFTTNDTADLRACLTKIRDDAALRSRLASEGLDTAGRYSWDAAVAGYEELLRQL